MISAMEVVGNPSSVHGEGRAAKAIVERARGQVAAALGAEGSDVVFTSGATEAIQLVFAQAWDETACSPAEHDAVLAQSSVMDVDPCTGSALLDRHGRFVASQVPEGARAGHAKAMQAPGRALFALTAANSETGVVQDLDPANQSPAWDYERSDRFCDATQAFGKLPFAFNWTQSEYACVSAHKIGGPKGVGALALRPGLDLDAVQKGGGQEMGRRSGTENVIGIAGFGAAAEAAERDLANGEWDRVAEMRDALEAMLLDAAPELVVFGKDVPRLPNTSNFAVPGWKGETQVMQMDLAGFAVSAGSACSSGKVKESRVLRAMGFDPVTASSAIRVSLGPTTQQAEVMAFADTWLEHYRRFKQRAA